jgi:hypothetical protein
MIFQSAYYAPMDRGYSGNSARDVNPSADIERPLSAVESPISNPIKEIGQTVAEGRQFGTFLQSAQAAIRMGTGQIELQPGMGGGEEPAGVENYGHEAREALRELAKVNKINISSVHTPVQIGNLSGYNPQEKSFNDDYRDKEIDEVKAAIKFAAEVSQGGAVVVHTGEFQRPMFDADWNTSNDKYKFRHYEEEHERAIKPLVDRRTGRLIQEVRMNQIVPRAVWNRYEKGNSVWEEKKGQDYNDEEGNVVEEGDYIDYEGLKMDRINRVPVYDPEKKTFKIHQQRWDDLVDEAEEINKERAEKAGMKYEDFKKSGRDDVVEPEEAFLHATTETQEAIAHGWAGNYLRHVDHYFGALETYKKALKFYEKLEGNISDDEKWKLKQEHREFELQNMGIVPTESKMPSEILKEKIDSTRREIASTKDMVQGQLQQAEEQSILRQHAMSAKKYALKQSMKSYAEAGIEAMQQSQNNPYAKDDVFVAPENIWPEMGYGSHPEELIELVQNARKAMVKHLTESHIEDPAGKLYSEKEAKSMGDLDLIGTPHMVTNPDYTKMTKEQAEKEAKDHIKATLDTQHMGMWFDSFEPLPKETRQDRKKRFNKWYLEEVEKLGKADIIGNIHLVDAIGGSHQHLVAGQGDLPLKETLTILKKHGFKGTINSEAHGEERFGQGRILTETWREFGAPIYGSSGYGMPGMPSANWKNVQHGYFGQTYPPYFIFGAYSPSNDWQLWSEVPME